MQSCWPTGRSSDALDAGDSLNTGLALLATRRTGDANTGDSLHTRGTSDTGLALNASSSVNTGLPTHTGLTLNANEANAGGTSNTSLTLHASLADAGDALDTRGPSNTRSALEARGALHTSGSVNTSSSLDAGRALSKLAEDQGGHADRDRAVGVELPNVASLTAFGRKDDQAFGQSTCGGVGCTSPSSSAGHPDSVLGCCRLVLQKDTVPSNEGLAVDRQ